MASFNLLSKVVTSKVEGMFKSDDSEKVPPSEKELREEDKRKQAQKDAEEERKKRHIKGRINGIGGSFIFNHANTEQYR